VSSLRVRLFLVQVIVVLVAVEAIALFARQATNREFQRYLERGGALRDKRFDATFGMYYADNGSWDGIQPLVERMGQALGQQLVLVDPSGVVLADSSRVLLGQEITADWRSPAAVVTFRGIPVGAIYVRASSLEPPPESNFSAGVDRWLLEAMLISGVVAIVLTLILSRRILSPVSALTAAARKMEAGDLSQRVQNLPTDEIGGLGRAFNAMASSLQQAEQLRRNMVGDVAHELRTPLSNLQGYLEALRDKVIEPTPEVIASLHDESILLNHLVNDLQELSLAEAGQLRLVRQPTALAGIVQQVVALIQPAAAAKGLTLRIDVPDDLPLVNVDGGRIAQVLRNLLDNALAYTPEGGTISVEGRGEGAEVRVSVRDTGLGIEPDKLPHVFERFYRADPSRTRDTGGTGLGLVIVKQWVEAHGGHVWAVSTPGAGSTFSFKLPAAD
jgi:signal transduction histidine kinase